VEPGFPAHARSDRNANCAVGFNVDRRVDDLYLGLESRPLAHDPDAAAWSGRRTVVQLFALQLGIVALLLPEHWCYAAMTGSWMMEGIALYLGAKSRKAHVVEECTRIGRMLAQGCADASSGAGDSGSWQVLPALRTRVSESIPQLTERYQSAAVRSARNLTVLVIAVLIALNLVLPSEELGWTIASWSVLLLAAVVGASEAARTFAWVRTTRQLDEIQLRATRSESHEPASSLRLFFAYGIATTLAPPVPRSARGD